VRGLAEMQVGDWQGQSLRRLSRHKLWPVIQHTPSLARFPGGESFPEAQARIVAALEALRARHPSPRAIVACFSHADMIKLAVAHYIGMPLDLFQRLALDPASITALHVRPERAILLRLNDTRATEAARAG
jgi:probable phosphoglycerate mutase